MTTPRALMVIVMTLALAGAACTLPATGAQVPTGEGGAIAPSTGIALPPAWTATPTPTQAPATLTPTPTPPFGLDWATPVPVDSDYAGWVRLDSKRASLWLPPGYAVVDMGEFGDLMALMAYAMTEAMGQMAGEMAAVFATPVPGQPTPTLVSLEELQETFLFDMVMGGSETDETAVFVVGEPPKPGIDLGAAIEGALSSFNGEPTVEAQHVLTDSLYPKARLVVSSVDAESGRQGRHLIYVLVIGERAWSLNYAAPAERFEQHLPLFEKSAASFGLNS